MFSLAFGIGAPGDIAIIAVVVVILFGTTKLAGLGKSLGEGIKEFKKATKDEDDPAGPPAATTPPPVAVTRTEEKRSDP